MTTPATTRKAGPLSCNGSVVDFDFDFAVFAEGDIEVILTNANSVDTTLTLTTNYTVTLNADQVTNPGGTVTTVSTYATGYTITVIGALAYSQPTELTNRGGFFPKVIEKALDRVTRLVQQLKETVDRSLRLSPATSSSVSAELPTPAALNVIGWNTTADALVNFDSASLAVSAATVDWITERFSGTGVLTAFTLSRDPGVASNCDVMVGGTPKVAGVDFSVSGTTLTFSAAPASGTNNVVVRYGSALPASGVPTGGVVTASIEDGAVTTAKLNDAVVDGLTSVSAASGDYVMIADVSDSNKKKKALISSLLSLSSSSTPFMPLTASVAANALTATLASGTVLQFNDGTSVTLGSSISVTVSSGSTLGTVSGQRSRVWVVALKNSGTPELAVMNALSGTSIAPINLGGTISTTAEGGAGAADSAQTWYSTTARSSQPFCVVGYIESTQATAGTWASSPTAQGYGPGIKLPGDVVQKLKTQTGTVATGLTTAIPHDNTIPQNTEGDQVMTQAITPTAACNLLEWQAVAFASNSTSSAMQGALFQDSTANALAAAECVGTTVTYSRPIVIDYTMVAGTTSSTTGKIRIGSDSGTTTFNGSSGGQIYGGVMNSWLQATEVMA